MLVWKGHGAKVRSLAFAPDGRSIVTTAGNSKFVWLWDATTGRLVRKFSGATSGATRTVAFFPDGKHVIGLHEYRQASVWHTDTGTRVAQLLAPGWLNPDTLAIPPDGSRIVLYTNRAFAEWSDPTRPTPGQRVYDRLHAAPQHLQVFPFQMGYTPTGIHYWLTSSYLTLLDPVTYAPRHVMGDNEGAWATTAAFTPDESRACVAFGHRAAIWRLDALRDEPVKLRGHKQKVMAVGFLPGGYSVFTAAMDGTVRLWDTSTGAELRAFDWGIGKVRVAAISPDGTTCAAGSADGRLVVWDVDL